MSARDHSYYQDLLELHVSGEPLPPPDRLALFDHIEDCDACREILEAETRITMRMKTVPRLVAPSDLRSKILSQAVRDHRERTTTPSEDPTVSDLLRARSAEPEPEVALAVTSAQKPEAASAKVAARSRAEELPVFAGVARPGRSRVQQVWRKASPALASSFMGAAALLALYFGQFQGVPLASEAQQLVWAAVNSITDKSGLESGSQFGGTAVAYNATVKPESNTVTEARPVPGRRPVTMVQAPSALPKVETVSLGHPSTSPLPGTDAVVSLVGELRRWGAAADSTVAALSRAASEPVPGPAEKAAPQIAALVLRPTDRDVAIGGFRESELAAALETVARTQPGGRIARQDQFAMDGHRYRLYTMDLPAGCANQMVQTLTPYESDADGIIVNALISQRGIAAQRSGAVQFYSSNVAHLSSALQTIQPVSNAGTSERIRVVLVE